MIYQCIPELKQSGGGIYTYIMSLLKHRTPNISDQVIFNLKKANQHYFDLLHIHDPKMLRDLKGECPAIFTLHNHSTYCPSGTKYLSLTRSCCDRSMSTTGCIWGHLVDGCGSRRPQRIFQGLQNSYQELKLVQQLKIPVIAISHYSQRQLLQHGLPPQQVILLHHGIEISETASCPLTLEAHQAQRILFVGRLVPHKGLDWLIKTMTQLDPFIKLDVAGEGWERSRLERLAKQLGVSDRITWHGWCSSQKLDQLYQQCFALVFPSLWPEPAGLVTLEAYARYRPVIASNLGGIPEYVRPGETGILVEANDSKQLAMAITELAKNYLRSRNMGELGHRWLLEEFTIDIHIKQLQSVYEKAIYCFRH